MVVIKIAVVLKEAHISSPMTKHTTFESKDRTFVHFQDTKMIESVRLYLFTSFVFVIKANSFKFMN